MNRSASKVRPELAQTRPRGTHTTPDPPDPRFEQDRDLIQACLAGDDSAWDRLLTRYERLIYSIARASGLDADESADVFQNVCLALHRGLPRLRAARAITRWILITSRRIARDHAVRARREVPLSDTLSPEASQLLQDPAPQISDALETLELQHLVRVELSRLGDPCRRLLIFLFYSDPPLAYRDIARELDIPVGSVGPTRARCLEKLRRTLE